MVIGVGLVGSSIGFTSERAKDKAIETLWDSAMYAFSRALCVILHPVSVTCGFMSLAYKVSTIAKPTKARCGSGNGNLSTTSDTVSETDAEYGT